MSSYTSDLATGKSSSTPIPLQIPQPPQTVTEQTTEAPTTASQVDNSAQPGHSFGKIGVHYGQAPAIQPKLTVGPVNDQYEQEADHVAAQVVGQVNSPTTQRQEMSEEEEELQTKPLADGVQRQATPEDEEELQTKLIENSIQRQEVPEEEEEIQTKALASTVQRQEMPEEEEQLQTKPLADSIQRQETPEEEELQTKPQIQRQADGSTAAPPAVEGAIHQARGSGQALSDATRQPMERAFGADFSRVKVHTDTQADQLNRSIQARAFTTGSDIFFRQGEHSPGTRAGQELLAHELTHVVQQNGEVQRLVQANRGGMETSSDAAATTRFGHDFSRIPIHSLQQAPVRTERTPRSQGVPPGVAKGETLGDEELFSPLKGEPGTETEGESATKGEGAKKVKKTELAAPTAGECGAYSWKVRFSVENTDATTTGYVVQKVDVTYARKDCIGNDKPVTGIGTFPYWEAWGVRGGKVFIGDTASEHNADTYADPAMGDRTYGSIAVKGTAEFFPNVTLPAHMKANNPATQAGALRSSTTDPALAGGTGSIPHDLTASWDCCGPLLPGAKEKLTTFSNKR